MFSISKSVIFNHLSFSVNFRKVQYSKPISQNVQNDWLDNPAKFRELQYRMFKLINFLNRS